MKRLTLISILLIFAALLAGTAALAQDETPFEQTQAALATTEAALGCDTRFIVWLNDGVTLSIRNGPGTQYQRLAVVNENSYILPNGLHAIEERRNPSGERWFQLCSLDERWVSGSTSYVHFATVTPSSTATASPGATARVAPTATPTRIGTPSGSAVWICWRGVCNECALPCALEIREKP